MVRATIKGPNIAFSAWLFISHFFLIDNSFALPSSQALQPEQVEAGQLLIHHNGGYRPTLNLATHVNFDINGLIAEVSVSQQFKNSSEDFVEAVYVFPLPENSAVNYLNMQIGERMIIGKIKPKQQAKRIYQQAKRAGKKASLVAQQRPNLFTNKVANIGPGETVTINIRYLQQVDYTQGEFSLRFPMTITPRYSPDLGLEKANTEYEIQPDLAWGVGTNQVVDTAPINPPVNNNQLNPISISGSLNMGLAIDGINSAYHPLVISEQNQTYQFDLKNPENMTKDFVISWQVANTPQPQVALFSQTIDNEDYALLMVVPPRQSTIQNTLAREIIYIIDTSGSMSGVSIRQAKQSLLLALDQLKTTDRFNIVEFNSRTIPLHPHAVPASRQHIRQAKHYVSALRASGGTEMVGALDFALTKPDAQKQLRQLVFITDGAVANEAALFKLIDEKLADDRLFTVAIGSAPNSYFMRKAAQFGRGSYNHIGSVTEVKDKMSRLFRTLNSPVASNISVQWGDAEQIESYPKRNPDLYTDQPLLLTAKLDRLNGSIKVTGELSTKTWQRLLTSQGTANHQGVGTLWARHKISDLLDTKIRGAKASHIKQQVTKVALQHQLMSPYTSFVAVEQTPSLAADKPLKSQAIANNIPKGQTMAYPKTSTHSLQHILYAMLLLLSALVVQILPTYIGERK